MKIPDSSDLKFELSHMEGGIRIAAVMLSLTCLVSVATPKSVFLEAEPRYQVKNSDGILGKYSLGENDNHFQMDCTGCFPQYEGRVISIKIQDLTEKCKTSANTSPKEHKNKMVATIYCPPCGNYDLMVSAKVMIKGLPENIEKIFKYRQDACPLSHAADVNASPQTKEEKTFPNNNSSSSLSAPTTFEKETMGATLNRKDDNTRSNGNNYGLNATLMVALLNFLANIHITTGNPQEPQLASV